MQTMPRFLAPGARQVVLAGSGHRPNKLPGGYSPEAANLLARVADAALRALDPDYVISGFALGWDTALVEAALMLQIPVIAAIPTAKQSSTWPPESQRIYDTLLEQVFQRVDLYDTDMYHPEQMQTRNEWMHDSSAGSLILWNGSKGGTYNYVKYAVAQASKPMYNVWPLFEASSVSISAGRPFPAMEHCLERLIIGYPEGVRGDFPRPGGDRP